MYSILLDSSNTSLCVGLCDEENLLDFVMYEAWQQQSELMIPELKNLLDKHHVSNNEIKDVVVAIGPGSYTGVRISITIAKVIGASLHCPIYPVSSLRVLKDYYQPSICLINARSGRSYFGVYENETIIIEDQILNNDEVIKYIEDHPSYSICGDCKYLGIDNQKEINTIKQMFLLKKYLKPIDDSLGLKPVYLKD